MDTKKQWILVTALVGVVILVAGFLFLVKPEHKKVSTLNGQVTSINGQTSTLQTRLSVLQNENRTLPAEKAKLAVDSQKIPAAEELPTLTRQLSAAAVQSNVDLTTFTPGTPAANTTAASAPAAGTSRVVTAPGSTATSTTGASSGSVEQVQLAMAVSGTYFDVETFLNALETLPRALLVDTVSLSYQGSTPSVATPGSGELTANITARAFVATSPLTGATAK